MASRTRQFVHIILINLLLAACARPNPGQVAKYSTAGKPITLTQLTRGSEASWSPDGKWIAYVDSGIWITDPRGKERIQLTSSGHAPSWSPDGKKLAYADGGIWVMELENRQSRRLTDEGHNPCWSADGRRIIYAAAGIWAVGVNGEAPERLMAEGIDPDCSPVDDRILVEIFNPDRLEFDIWLVHPPQKPKLLAANAESPAWSADGKYLLYCSTGIWIAEASGKAQRLTVYGHQPAWSPDGSKILLSFQNHIWLMDSPYK
jgi:Tol biopolymer transport system component